MALRDALDKIKEIEEVEDRADALLEIAVVLPNRRCRLFLAREEMYEQKERLRMIAILNLSDEKREKP